MSWQLALTVDRESRLPLAAQVRNSLRRAFEDGTLRPGTRIPSTRQLAHDVGVSRSVVVEAYEQLAAEGYLLTKRGSGTTVSDPPTSQEVPTLVLPSPDRESADTMWDLRTGTSDIAAFPARTGSAASPPWSTTPDATSSATPRPPAYHWPATC